MRKFSFYGLVLGTFLTFSSCLKKEWKCPYSELNIKAPESEVVNLGEYLDSRGIVAQEDPSGLYYIVEAEGTGTTAEVCSIVTVNYTGRFINDEIFDSTNGTPVQFRLGDLIPGWQKGIKHIKPGGKIKLFIPPSLGYGSVDRKDMNDNVVVPANSMLIFNLDLIAVQ